MQTNCVKLVEKVVYKYAKSLFTFSVEKFKAVNKKLPLLRIARVFTKNTQQLLTAKNCKTNLLNWAFAQFPHSSTITTNLYIRKI